MADLKTINYPVTPLYLDAQIMAKSLSVTIASDQTPIPVSGTFSFSNPSVGPNDTTLPTSSNLIGGNDGGILRPIDVTRLSSINYLKVDASAFTQPVSATSLPLPSNAAKETGGNLATVASVVTQGAASYSSTGNASMIAGFDGTNARLLSLDSTGKVNVTGSITASNASIGTNGGALPTSSTLVGGSTGSTIQPITSTAIGAKNAFDISVTSEPSSDVLATTVTGTRNNQIEISFESAPSATLITNTTSGGASVTYSNGQALYSTGTATSAEAKGVTVGTVVYRPAHEIYAYFTAAFTTPTSANSYQRIGIYDANNGFFIGYNGTNFGITKRTSGVDTFTNRSAWNNDLLNGASGSKFTRNGTPEAINLAYTNLFRIRFAWLGSASILFDVFSPDGIWVTFNTIKQPNTALIPSISSPNLPITIDVQKSSADATNLVMATACWAGGTTSGYSKITDTLTDNSLASITRSVITGVTTGGGGGYINVKVNPSGALVADVTGTVAATQSGTWNINNVSGTVSLPTGAATNAAQTAVQSSPGSSASTAITIQGSASGVAVPISASSLPLPTLAATSTKQSDGSQKTQIVDGSGNVIASTSNALNVSVTNTSIQSKAAVNLNGSGSGAAATVSTVITLTAPSNAVGFVLMNMDTSSANIRYAIGRTASATLGQQLQPGRDTGFIPCGANISLCAESGTQTYDIQWVSQ